MGDRTGISWTDATWNPIRGCSRVSEGCRHCYAERVAARFSVPGQPYEGLATRKLKVIGDDEQRTEGRWTGDVRLVAEHLADPLRWRRPRRIFVNSMSDLFHESLSNEQIAAVFGVMAAAPQHTFQVLTKRAKRMREWFAWVDRQAKDDGGAWTTCLRETVSSLPDDRISNQLVEDGIARDGAFPDREPWPLPNVWLGVSVENQTAADERIPDLLATPAAVRFLSCEPLLGAVRVDSVRVSDGLVAIDALRGLGPRHVVPRPSLPGRIDWIVAGCESGPGARPCSVEWLRSLRDQCVAADVPYFLKQAHAEIESARTPDGPDQVAAGPGSKRKAGGVIELPYLDGVQHAAFPKETP